ncbi:acyl carrier protein [bacterium]|nr:acyl carrier protein [bacterium]
MTDKILNCICDVFDLDRTEISAETSQSDVDGWDSVGAVRLVLSLEEEFGVSIPPESGRQMTGCREIEAELVKLGANGQ